MQPHQLFDVELNVLDREALADFLRTEVGKRVLRSLYFNAPTPTDSKGDLTFRAGLAAGWRNAVTQLMLLAEKPAAGGGFAQERPLVLIDSPDEFFDPATNLPRE
jgi:hypothetical protein